MEGERRGNTAMLTVIAIATLLVAVVGATFAYFSANQSNDAQVNVTATTSKRDVIVVTGSGALSITTDNEIMSQPRANDDTAAYTVTDNNVTVDITAGTGTAKCEYDLVYHATTQVFPGTTGATKELTISGSSSSGNSFGEVNLAGCPASGNDVCVLNGNTKLVSSGGTSGATDTWTLTMKFYNLTANQDAISNNTYGGTVTVENLVCSNDSANGTTGEPAQDNTYSRTTQQ